MLDWHSRCGTTKVVVDQAPLEGFAKWSHCPHRRGPPGFSGWGEPRGARGSFDSTANCSTQAVSTESARFRARARKRRRANLRYFVTIVTCLGDLSATSRQGRDAKASSATPSSPDRRAASKRSFGHIRRKGTPRNGERRSSLPRFSHAWSLPTRRSGVTTRTTSTYPVSRLTGPRGA